MRIILFDIDGTLMRTNGAGRRALDGAFLHLYGRSDACDGIAFQGNTDMAIVAEALEAMGEPADEAAVGRVLSAYLERLPGALESAGTCEVIEGVLPILEALEANDGDLAIGLGTGNVERGARIKLSQLGLSERFAFGGFGDDAYERHLLLRRGVERGAAQRGRSPAEARVVVVGDTRRDVEAAKQIGAQCVAVATGPESLESLAATQPTLAVPNLAASGVLDVLLGS